MAKASESCTQLIIFLCTFPWLLWSFSSIYENYKHVLIICQWNNHKGTKSLKKIFLIVACFAQSPSIKFSICRVKVTATERSQLEWRVRAGPGWGERWGLVLAGVKGEGWSRLGWGAWAGPGAQLWKRLPSFLLFFPSAWRHEHLTSCFYHLWFIQSPPLGTLIPFLSHQVESTWSTDFTRPLSCLHFSWQGQKKPGDPRRQVVFSCIYFQIP